jgi:hypothetical protein
MKTRPFIVLVLLLLFGLNSISAQETTRPYYLGFTPFPYELSFEAVDYVYERIAEDADLIAHHFDNGVPWVEALHDQPYSDNIMNDWEWRRSHTPDDHQVYVSIAPIRLTRDGLALYRGETDDMPLPAPWDTYTFDHPDVETAFMNYAVDIVDYFQPDYFVFSIETNLLMKLRPDLWDGYMTLHRNVYTRLKDLYPDLPTFASMTGIDLIPGYTDADTADQAQAFADVIEYTDYLGLSVYPYMTGYMTNALPTSLFDELAALTDKPIAVTETGYPAQDFAIQAGDTRLEFDSDETKQAEYITFLLVEAAQHDFVFVINFILRDYDAVWEMLGSNEDLTIAWRDTGLYAEDGAERPALAVWREALALPIASP